METLVERDGEWELTAYFGRATGRLSKTARALSSLLEGAEDEFLSVGTNLGGIAGRASELMDGAAAAANLLGAAGMGRALDVLGTLRAPPPATGGGAEGLGANVELF